VHPGVSVVRLSLQGVVREKEREGGNVFVLEEKGEDVWKVKFGENPTFVLGDQVGLPKKDERYVLRFGRKISLGKKRIWQQPVWTLLIIWLICRTCSKLHVKWCTTFFSVFFINYTKI